MNEPEKLILKTCLLDLRSAVAATIISSIAEKSKMYIFAVVGIDHIIGMKMHLKHFGFQKIATYSSVKGVTIPNISVCLKAIVLI